MTASRMATTFSAVLVTGGTDGLGRAAAVMLAEHGYRVFAAGRDPVARSGVRA